MLTEKLVHSNLLYDLNILRDLVSLWQKFMNSAG